MPTPERIKRFYKSKAWIQVRQAVRIQQRGICQSCGKAGWEVHHKIPLTLENVDDPNIALNPDNLELLCTACHDAKRGNDVYVRNDLTFDANGQLIKRA
jgi:5-methylcytosine-specific restriction endonuclease McrA